DAADARARDHRARLGERDAGLLRSEQLEELLLLGVVGARGIAERRPDAAKALVDELFARQPVALLVPRTPRPLVQPLRERLREPVGERLRHDRAVVVVLGLEPGDELVQAETGGDRERAEVVAARG